MAKKVEKEAPAIQPVAPVRPETDFENRRKEHEERIAEIRKQHEERRAEMQKRYEDRRKENEERMKTMRAERQAFQQRSKVMAPLASGNKGWYALTKGFQTASFANPLNIDCTTYKDWICTVTGDCTVNLNNVEDGDAGMLELIIDASGVDITFGAMWTKKMGPTDLDMNAGADNIISWRAIGEGSTQEIVYTVGIIVKSEKTLMLVFDNIVNVPVIDASSVSDWNTFFDLPTYGTSFTSVTVNGNVVTLEGGSDIKLKDNLFWVDEVMFTSLLEFVDLGCITEVGNYCFYGCTSLSNLSFSENLIKIGGWAFAGGIFTEFTILNYF